MRIIFQQRYTGETFGHVEMDQVPRIGDVVTMHGESSTVVEVHWQIDPSNPTGSTVLVQLSMASPS